MEINITELQKATEPMNKTEKHLNNAISLFLKITQPENYGYPKTLNNVETKLKTIHGSIEDLRLKLESFIYDVSMAEKKNKKQAQKISNPTADTKVEDNKKTTTTSDAASTPEPTVDTKVGDNNTITTTPDAASTPEPTVNTKVGDNNTITTTPDVASIPDTNTNTNNNTNIQNTTNTSTPTPVEIETVQETQTVLETTVTTNNLVELANSLWYFTNDKGTKITTGSTEYSNSVKDKVSLTFKTSLEYEKLKDVLNKQYGITDAKEAQKLITMMYNYKDMSIFASAITKIAEKYKTQLDDFKNKFGFDLYVTKNNKQVLNTERLYMELFINSNKKFLFAKNAKGETIINPTIIQLDSNNIASVRNAVSLIEGKETAKERISSYLKSKNIEVDL